MTGKIESGQLCTVVPIKDTEQLKKGDIVLCKVNGREYLHLIKAVAAQRFQIGKVESTGGSDRTRYSES